MLGFTLTAIALVEIAGFFSPGVWENEGSLSFIIGGFSGFLLNESGADFRSTDGGIRLDDGISDLCICRIQPIFLTLSDAQ